jgi:peroxiredoxin family protein
MSSAAVERVSIVVSKGSLEGVYPGLIMANGARAEGIEADLFFTFFGLDAITRARSGRVKVAAVGNPGLHLPSLLGMLPGASAALTGYFHRKMAALDIPRVPEFVEMIADAGAGLYGCKASCDLFGITEVDLVDRVKGIITVGEFYELSGGGQIVFT